MLRRAATALRECRSGDIFTAARPTLEAAVRSESDILQLLNDVPKPKPSVEAVAHA